jgi:hypothetical protein
MKKILLIMAMVLVTGIVSAQTEKEKVERACLDYIEGFYQGDTTKLIRSLKPSLYKFGYWKSDKSGKYEPDGQMTFRDAVKYASNVLAKKNFAKPDAPKKVEILDIGNHIASAKVTAWWGIDYILLARQDDRWVIEQVLWEGPPKK